MSTIVVIDYEKLYNNLLTKYGASKTIIKFTKSGGVEHKNDREAIIHENLHHYFQGNLRAIKHFDTDQKTFNLADDHLYMITEISNQNAALPLSYM